MPVYLINGISTSGKTSIGHELSKRGYRVIDTDKSFGYYANLATEKPVNFPANTSPDRQWYKVNGWIWQRQKVEHFFKGAANEVVFFCGGSLNESLFYSYFSRIFRLTIDPETLVQRLKSRGLDPHTNNPVFIKRMLNFRETYESDAHRLGWILIDTSHRTITESVNDILGHVRG